MENWFALPGCSILHLTTVPLSLQFILLIGWTFCGLYVFRCGAFALDRLLIIIIIIIIITSTDFFSKAMEENHINEIGKNLMPKVCLRSNL